MRHHSRKAQAVVRAHCAALGMPICHDRIYPTLLAENTDDYTKPLQLLAKAIAFRDPISGEQRNFRSAKTLTFDAGETM